MNKLKTHSGAKKRFRVTGTGKIKYKQAGQRHLLTGMSSNRGRRLRRTEVLSGPERKIIKLTLGNR
ncbi:MAG: 50S ribosomal protein L35 [Elusimicrobia bacterium]|nr:50S ribosomal protein L35 [Elusimicrobiota bacterium]MBU2614103.1 50S ribosomal protein L35 [Elusimicrobiota bacterium]